MGNAALLDNPAIVRQVHRFTLGEYQSLALSGQVHQKTELIEGVIINKMPKSPLHVYLIETLREILVNSLSAGFLLLQEQPISIAAIDSEPDLCVVQGDKKDFLLAHPHTAILVVEVAVSSLSLDRSKLRSYALAKVPEVWIIRSDNRTIEVHSVPEGEGYLQTSVFTEKDTLSFQVGFIPIRSIFTNIS